MGNAKHIERMKRRMRQREAAAERDEQPTPHGAVIRDAAGRVVRVLPSKVS